MNLLTAIPMVLDFETTGIDPEKDRAVEVASVIYRDRKLTKFASFINPGRDIPPEASAVNHILLEDVSSAPAWPEVKAKVLAQEFDVIVAHNAAFDAAFLAQNGGLPEGKPILCTWRMAKKLIPDLPSYSNMALHYRLGLPGRPAESHRAMADALVTMGLFQHLLPLAAKKAQDPGQIDTETFVKWVNGPMMEHTVKFGKHSGKKWADLAKEDPSYLRWVLEKSDIAAKNPDVRFTIETLLKGTR